MASELTAADVSHRLADQLQVLSQVAETLTFRLLDLEERLAGQELQLQPLLHGGAAGSGLIAEDTALRLAETEDRLAQLESLLEVGLAAGAEAEVEPEVDTGSEVYAETEVHQESEHALETDLDSDTDLDSEADRDDGSFELVRHLHSVATEPSAAEDITGDLGGSGESGDAGEAMADQDASYDADPFLEEHEQPFMDELSA